MEHLKDFFVLFFTVKSTKGNNTVNIIKSKDNSLIKQIVSLIENRKERVKNNAFVAEGARFCKEAVISGVKIHYVLMTEDFQKAHAEDAACFTAVCENVYLISEQVAKKLSSTVNSQGVFCVCAIPSHSQRICGNKYIALENLQDPGNIGTIIRSAEAFGVDGVVLIGNCADVYSPKVLRSTMGTIFHLPIFSFENSEDACKLFKSNGYTVYGAVLERNSLQLSQVNFLQKTVCLIGNEANGLTDSAKQFCDEFLFIEMSGKAESLNAAVAASVIMWEMQK